MALKPETVRRNRELSGDYIKRARERLGMTQMELAKACGIEHYTFVSQMERGHATIPPALFVPLATALGIDRREFALRMLKWHHEDIYAALFDGKSLEEAGRMIRRD